MGAENKVLTCIYKCVVNRCTLVGMACDDCNASAAWYDLDRAVTSLGWAVIGLWALVALVIWALISRNVITWADLLPKVAAE